MLHFHKFRQDLFGPVPGREVYIKRTGHGWPEQCPPIRAAASFGFDILANFSVTFTRKRDGDWRVEPDVVIESDFNWSADDDSDGHPLTQQYAWFWERGQTLPHKISDDVYAAIRNQVKISSFLYLATDPNEVLIMGEIPNMNRKWKAITAMIEPDWYPASYPWHAVIELDPREKKITIERGEPLCRITPVRRDTYFARPMSVGEFDDFFERGQTWLRTYGKPAHVAESDSDGPEESGDKSTLDITKTYSKQQAKSRFIVLP